VLRRDDELLPLMPGQVLERPTVLVPEPELEKEKVAYC